MATGPRSQDSLASATRGAAARRVRYGLLPLARIAMTTRLCARAQFLAETKRVRIDVTATREHCSPRTKAMLAALDTPHEPSSSRERPPSTRPAHDASSTSSTRSGRASTNLTATWIDPATPGGRAAFETLPPRLRAMREDEVVRGAQAMAGAIDAARDVGGRLASIGSRLAGWSAALPNLPADIRDALDELAAVPRVHERELTQVADAYPVAGVVRVAGIELPDVGAAQGSLGVVLKRAADAMETVIRAANSVVPRDEFSAIAPDARAVLREAELARDEALRAHDDQPRSA